MEAMTTTRMSKPAEGFAPRVCAYPKCPRKGKPFRPTAPHQRFCRSFRGKPTHCRQLEWQRRRNLELTQLREAATP